MTEKALSKTISKYLINNHCATLHWVSQTTSFLLKAPTDPKSCHDWQDILLIYSPKFYRCCKIFIHDRDSSDLSPSFPPAYELLIKYDQFHLSSTRKSPLLNKFKNTDELNESDHKDFPDIFRSNVSVTHSKDCSTAKIKRVNIFGQIIGSMNSNFDDPTVSFLVPSRSKQSKRLHKQIFTKKWATIIKLIIESRILTLYS